MSRVLVLGGTGFVGPFVVRRLVEQGHEVTLFALGFETTALGRTEADRNDGPRPVAFPLSE